jgi:hypothetical protein
MAVRRARGALLRLVRRRPLAIAVGAALALPAAWAELGGHGGPWWLDGLILVAGATGLALVWQGAVGATPDWIDRDD